MISKPVLTKNDDFKQFINKNSKVNQGYISLHLYLWAWKLLFEVCLLLLLLLFFLHWRWSQRGSFATFHDLMNYPTVDSAFISFSMRQWWLVILQWQPWRKETLFNFSDEGISFVTNRMNLQGKESRKWSIKERSLSLNENLSLFSFSTSNLSLKKKSYSAVYAAHYRLIYLFFLLWAVNYNDSRKSPFVNRIHSYF